MKPTTTWILSTIVLLLLNLYQYDKRKALEAEHRDQIKLSAVRSNEFAHNNYASGVKVGYILHAKGADKDTVQSIINEWPRTEVLNAYLLK